MRMGSEEGMIPAFGVYPQVQGERFVKGYTGPDNL